MKNVSYSQMSTYNECNYKWYLTYAKNLRSMDTNIHLLFGKSMHTVLQEYLKKMYTTTAKEADEMDLETMLKLELTKEFLAAKDASGNAPATKEELVEFYQDGVNIIEFFRKNRGDYFSKKGYALIGIELPLQKSLHNNVQFSGYIDVAILDEIHGKIKIVDFKTSTNGWKDYAKKDVNKTAQLVLYKKFYSDLFEIPIDKIDVEFIILKRKLYENSDFPQKRFQKFSPASGTVSVNQTMRMLNEFINACFTPEGEYNTQRDFKKTDEGRKCQWCEHFKKNCQGI